MRAREAHNNTPAAAAGDGTTPERTDRQKQMIQGDATTQYAEHRTSYNRLKAEDEKAAKESAGKDE